MRNYDSDYGSWKPLPKPPAPTDKPKPVLFPGLGDDDEPKRPPGLDYERDNVGPKATHSDILALPSERLLTKINRWRNQILEIGEFELLDCITVIEPDSEPTMQGKSDRPTSNEQALKFYRVILGGPLRVCSYPDEVAGVM